MGRQTQLDTVLIDQGCSAYSQRGSFDYLSLAMTAGRNVDLDSIKAKGTDSISRSFDFGEIKY